MKPVRLLLFFVVFVVCIQPGWSQSHFTPPNNNFQPMNIYIIQAAYNGQPLSYPDEVGVFDGSLCVGAIQLGSTPTASDPALLNAYKADDGDPGFIDGHSMIFKVWDASQGQEHTLSSSEVQFYDPATGEPISPVPFEGQGTAMVSLNGGETSDLNLTMQTLGNGTTTPSPGVHSYNYGEVVNLSATPDAGWEFDHWEGNVGDPNDPSTNITLYNNETVTAHFTCIGRTLTMAVSPSGKGTTVPSLGDTTVCDGSTITIKAHPISGYEFVQWLGSDIADPNSATTTVTVSSSKTVTAEFQQITGAFYDLTISVNESNWGSTTPSPGTYSIRKDSVVTVTATPNSGYEFINWTGDVADPNSATTTVTVDGNKSITANFARLQYDLTMQVNDPSWGNTFPSPGTHAYDSGNIVSIIASAGTGYQFVNWTGDVAEPQNSSTTVTMDGDKTVTANFEPIEYTLTIENTAGGSTTPAAGTYTHNYDDVVDITATPDAGYYFVQWNGDVDDPNSASTTVTITSDKTISATFAEIETYAVTFSASPTDGGTTDPSPGTYSYDENEQVNISAISNVGYHFTHWTGSGIENANDSTTVLTVNESQNIVAHFALNNLPQHTLTMAVNQSGWGHTDPSVGDHQYSEGTVVTVTAIEASGYRFVNWIGPVNNANNKTTSVLIDGDKTVTANFEPIPEYTITVLPPDDTSMGNTNPGPGTYPALEGEEFTITANPFSGYNFVNWNGNESLTNSTLNFIVTQDRTVKPYFEATANAVLTVKINNPEWGSVNPTVGQHTYSAGDVVNLEANPEQGFRFSHWEGSVAGEFARYTTITMDENKTVTANFAQLDYRLTLTPSPENAGTTKPHVGDQWYKSWSTIEIEAIPSTGYKFVGWTGEVAEPSQQITTILMDDDHNVKANFSRTDDYTLTVNVSPKNSGTTQPAVGTHVYNQNETVQVTATPDSGYVFKEWIGDVAEKYSPTTTITIDSDKNITAVFEEEQSTTYDLTIQVNPSNGGTTYPQVGTYTFQTGESVALTATPAEDYKFSSWSGDVDNPQSASTHIVMDSDKTVTANFEAGETEYTFTIDVYPAGSGTTQPAIGTHNFELGTRVPIIAFPNEGYKFEFWTGDVPEPYNDSTSVIMDVNKGVIAHFRKIEGTKHTLSITANPISGGSVIPSAGDHSYESGTVVTVKAIPASGYEFVRWDGNVADTNSEITTITMDADYEIAAIFQQSQDQTFLTMQVEPPNTGATGPSVGRHSFTINEKVNVTAVPVQGYEFSHWTGDVIDSSKATTSIRMNENKTLTAHFVPQQTNVATLNISSSPDSGGTTEPSSGTHDYPIGTVVTLQAQSAMGYKFIGWQGDVENPVDSSTTITMDVSKTVVAVFQKQDESQAVLSLNISPVGGGTTAPSPGIHIYPVGESVTLTATPTEGYHFKEWIGDVANKKSVTTTVTMDDNKTITAVFETGEPQEYTLEMIVNPAGAGVTAPAVGEHTFKEGDVVNITTIPAPGFQFDGWTGGVAEPESTTTAVTMTGNKIIVANFKSVAPSEYTLKIKVEPEEGGVTVPGTGTYTLNKDSLFTVRAVAASGYRFAGWQGDVADPDTAITTVQMDDNKTIIATFEPDTYVVRLTAKPGNGGTTSPALGDTTVDAGASLTVAAFPNEGFRFAYWDGDASGTSNPTTITVDSDKQINANFVELEEKASTPSITGYTDAFRQAVLDFYVRNDSSNLGHNLEYQFDWGDGTRSDWTELSSQRDNNITKITTENGNSGLPSHGHLIDYQTGEKTDVTLNVAGGEFNGTLHAMLGANPAAGTDAWDIFNGIVTCRGTINHIDEPDKPLVITLSGLDKTKHYTLAFYSNRDNFAWNRSSLITLSGADQFINTSSPGKDEFGNDIFSGPDDNQVKLPADNTFRGYVVKFSQISAGNDGQVMLTVSFGGTKNHEYKGKYASALMVKETDPESGAQSFSAYNDFASGGKFYSHRYEKNGSYLVRVRARCKTHNQVVSSWSETHSLIITGCTVNTRVEPSNAGHIERMPNKSDYDYCTPMTLLAVPANGYMFSHWNEDATDSLSTKVVTINNNKSFTAHFKLISSVNENAGIPESFRLGHNFPNPFNPTTEIRYDLPQPSQVKIQIFDLQGRLVKTLINKEQPAGHHSVIWDARNSAGHKVSTGLYFYRMQAGSFNQVKRMILLK